ncbi:MAG TPA: hypothetical protein VGN26_05720 [Armatimonadota bacterium]
MHLGLDARVAVPTRGLPASAGGSSPARGTLPAATTWAVLLIAGALVLCLAFAIAWFKNQEVEMEWRTAGDVLAERRPVRLMDLDFARLHREFDGRYRQPLRFRLESDRDGTRVVVLDTKKQTLTQRKVGYDDLNQEVILGNYHARMGEPANSVTLYYKKSRAMLVIQQIDE